MDRFKTQIEAISNGESSYDREFNANFINITFDWFKDFKETLENQETLKKWNQVDTFVVIPVDAKNETRLFNTLEQYSKKQDLNSSQYGLVLFLNSKDGSNIAKTQVELFQNKYPDINLTFHYHQFLQSEIKTLNIAKIRNVSYSFVSLLSNYLKKGSKNVTLIGADADAIEVSTNYLSRHRDICLTKGDNDQNIYTCATSKWLWHLTGNIYYDFFLLNNQIDNIGSIDPKKKPLQKYPSENMTSFSLEVYESLPGLGVDANNVSENYKLIEYSNTTSKPRNYQPETYIITDQRRAVDFIQKSKSTEILDLNRMWSKKGSWGISGDEARASKNLEISNNLDDKTQLQQIVRLIFEINLANSIQTTLYGEWDFKNIVNKIVKSFGDSENEDFELKLKNTQNLSPNATELRDVVFTIFYQLILISIQETLSNTTKTLENFNGISSKFDLKKYIKELDDSKDFSLVVEKLFAKLFSLIIELNPLEEIQGDFKENQPDNSDPGNILNIKPLHEIIEIIICSFGLIVKKINNSDMSNNLFGDLNTFREPLDEFVDYDQIIQNIKSYQEKQWIS